MNLDRILNIEDLHRAARRRYPRVVFDFVEGGVEDEYALARNEATFKRRHLLPRYMVDVSEIDQSAEIFGRTYASPFGIAPVGLAGLFRHGADLMLARAAADADIPFTLSGAGTSSLESVARVAPDNAWFQLYGAKDRKISEDFIRRAADAGYKNLVFTVDVPILSKREREIRNRFGQPWMPLRNYLDAFCHPLWLAGYLRHGMPLFEGWVPYAGTSSPKKVVKFMQSQAPAPSQTWRDVEKFRALWPGRMVLKGIMRADDALRAAELGVDGVQVSNHGGRQLDTAPSPLEVLPAIRAAVGDRMAITYDGGIRRGSDIVIALALGADFVFFGRPTIYGMAAFGLPGARKAIAILRQEIELTLRQIGCPRAADLGPDFIFEST